MYQQGNFPLTEGQTNYSVNFSTLFPSVAPQLILTDIFNINEDDPQEFLDGSVISRTTSGFEFSLVTAPPDGNYVLSWMASDGLGSNLVSSNGLPVSEFPIFTNNSLPENTIFPVVVPNGPYRSYGVRWNKIKTLMAASHQHLAQDISDSTLLGRDLLKSETQSAARNVISAAAVNHGHNIEDLVDASMLGLTILAAEDEESARELLDVPASNHTHTVADLSDASTLAKSVLEATSATSMRTLLEVPNLAHTHNAEDITDSTSIGRSVLTAVSEDAARDATKSASVVGWENTAVLSSSRSLLTADIGCKFVVSNVVTYTIPLGVNGLGRIGFYVVANGNLSISPAIGVIVRDANGATISSLASLPSGMYVLELIGLNLFCLTGFSSAYQRGLQQATDATTFASAAGLSASVLPGISGLGASLIGVTNQGQLSALTTNYYPILADGSDSLGSFITDKPSGIMFVVDGGNFDIDTIGSGMLPGESFLIYNDSEDPLIVAPAGTISLNQGTRSVRITPGSYLKFLCVAEDSLVCGYATLGGGEDDWVAYVSPHGNDFSGVIGDITRPFASVSYALTLLSFSDKRVVTVLPGNYTSAQVSLVQNSEVTTHINFLPGAYVSLNSGGNLFNQSSGQLFIKGGNFTISGSGGRFAYLSSGDLDVFNADVDSIIVASSTSGLPVVETFEVTSSISAYQNMLKAETINCAPVNLVKAVSGDFTVVVRNLTCGNSAILSTESVVNLTVDSGLFLCANRIVDSTSSACTINLHLAGSAVKQGGVGSYTTNAPILGMPASASSVIRVTGSGGSIEGIFADLGSRISVAYADQGALIISNVTIIGSLVAGPGNLTINSVFIKVLDSTGDFSIDTNDDTPRSVYVLGNCCSNKDVNTDDITYIGGVVTTDTNFII